jgi:dipeptidyl aminopeptidase/acylaminoacyl peptidase
MRLRTCLSCACTGALLLTSPAPWAPAVQAAAKHPVTIEDSVNLRGVSSAQISPDGTRVLYTVRAWEWPGSKADPERKGEPDKGAKPPEMRTHIWMAPASGAQPARQVTFGDKGESAPAWSPDGRYISFMATRGAGAGAGDAAGGDAADGPKAQIWLMRADGGEAQQLSEAPEGVTAFEWAPDSRRIAYVMRDPLPKEDADAQKRKDDERVYELDRQLQHIWVIDVESRKAEQITRGDYTVSTLSWSPDSARIAFAARKSLLIRDERSDVQAVTVATGAIEAIAATPAPEGSPEWSPDGKTIAYSLTPMGDAQTNADGIYTRPLYNAHLMLYDVASRQARDASDPAFDYPVSSVTWSPDSARVIFNSGDRVYRSMFAYDIAARRYRALTRERMVTFGSLSRDGSTAAFTMDSPTAPADVYVAGADFASPRKLTTVNPEAADFTIGETEVLTWKSSDGLAIEGVLVKPAGYEPGRKYPLLVDVHGGPTGAHVNGFKVGVHGGAQLWAGQGWAVLYPNPRGSSNYGEKFMRGNIPDWGGGDYRDIMTGVDEVIRRGVADPDKLAVMGWSYGGYMTCWIVSQTSRFKAARMGAGLSDLYSMYGTTDIPGYIGTFFDNYPDEKTLKLYRERSGLTYADRVTTPLLILHGLNDERVPIGQPMEFYRALKDRGKTVELVWYPREGHGFSEYYHQRDQIRRELEWMTRYVLGKPQSTAP